MPTTVTMQRNSLAALPCACPSRYGYRSVWEVEAVVANYSAAGLPLEAIWTDVSVLPLSYCRHIAGTASATATCGCMARGLPSAGWQGGHMDSVQRQTSPPQQLVSVPAKCFRSVQVPVPAPLPPPQIDHMDGWKDFTFHPTNFPLPEMQASGVAGWWGQAAWVLSVCGVQTVCGSHPFACHVQWTVGHTWQSTVGWGA